MAGMRDKLIHDYMGVDYNLVFKTAKENIAAKEKERISKYLQNTMYA